MASRKKSQADTGRTDRGNTRDQKVDRIGRVTIYRRGTTYYLYYREHRKSVRCRIEGNLAVARASASKVNAALEEQQPTPFGFDRTTPQQLLDGFLAYVREVKRLAWRTVDRYRAALTRFREFCDSAGIASIDKVDVGSVEDLVRWLRGQKRTRNGHKHGSRDSYKSGGIKFILSTCRTAFNWAGRRRMLPPFAENPFSSFPAEQLKDENDEQSGHRVFTSKQESDFFATCDAWQADIFRTLASLGMRAGELTHLLIEDVNFEQGCLTICSKPELFWHVKTSRRRVLPLAGDLRERFRSLIGQRKAGFVFLDRKFAEGQLNAPKRFATDAAFRTYLRQHAETLTKQHEPLGEDEVRKAITRLCHRFGCIPVKRLQTEFCKLTTAIGCPEFTRTHDLRHLFATRAQEAGANPLLVQEILGHSTLDMTRRYSHLSLDAKRSTVEALMRSTSNGAASTKGDELNAN